MSIYRRIPEVVDNVTDIIVRPVTRGVPQGDKEAWETFTREPRNVTNNVRAALESGIGRALDALRLNTAGGVLGWGAGLGLVDGVGRLGGSALERASSPPPPGAETGVPDGEELPPGSVADRVQTERDHPYRSDPMWEILGRYGPDELSRLQRERAEQFDISQAKVAAERRKLERIRAWQDVTKTQIAANVAGQAALAQTIYLSMQPNSNTAAVMQQSFANAMSPLATALVSPKPRTSVGLPSIPTLGGNNVLSLGGLPK